MPRDRRSPLVSTSRSARLAAALRPAELKGSSSEVSDLQIDKTIGYLSLKPAATAAAREQRANTGDSKYRADQAKWSDDSSARSSQLQ